jgi:hypothetical protein
MSQRAFGSTLTVASCDSTSPLCETISKTIAALEDGLAVMLRGYDYAQDLGCSVWDFSLDSQLLADRGICDIDLQWLERKGFIARRKDASGHSPDMGTSSDLKLNGHNGAARYVLTSGGALFARHICFGRANIDADRSPVLDIRVRDDTVHQPFWDPRKRELWFENHLVKRFRVPAGNQKLVLSAFQEESWPSSILDPLPPVADGDSKCRLHGTIVRLNTHQHKQLIQFRENGKGNGICWERSVRRKLIPN